LKTYEDYVELIVMTLRPLRARLIEALEAGYAVARSDQLEPWHPVV
jgi:hypothetical protein